MPIHKETICHAASSTEASILPGFGFNCFSFRVSGEGEPLEVLWSAPDLEKGAARPSGSGIPILFPFPGRIKGTVLDWDGRSFHLSEGDGLGNAIHGFVHERPWRVIEKTDSRIVGEFQASVDDAELLACWPADFRITADYEVGDGTLTTIYKIENPCSRSLPFGFGTHPYFCVPLGGELADGCEVKLPVKQKWELDGMIVTGKSEPLAESAEYQAGLKFGDMQFDNVFGQLDAVDGVCTSSVHDPASGRTMTMTFDDSFGKCVVYNPPHREAICVEPYTCLPDPFRLEREGVDGGLRVLEPGETYIAKIQIAIT